MAYDYKTGHFTSNKFNNLDLKQPTTYEITGTVIDGNESIVFKKTVTGNTTLTFSNLKEGSITTVLIENTGAYAVSFDDLGLVWPGGVAPSTPVGLQQFTFLKIDSSIYGVQVFETPAPGPLYSQEVLADNPAIYWQLNDASSPLLDSSGNSNNGTGNGAIQYGVVGQINNAIRLNGPGIDVQSPFNSPLDVGQNPYGTLSTETLSIECWVKTTSSTSMLVSYFDNSGNWSPELYITTNALKLYYFPPHNNNLTSPAIVNDGNWHHIVATYNNLIGSKIYVDGVLTASGPISSGSGGKIARFPGYWWVGRGVNVSSGTDLVVQHVAIYTTELSAARILAHYNAGIA